MAANLTRIGPDLTNDDTIFYTVTLSQAQTGGSAAWFNIRSLGGTGTTPTVASVRPVGSDSTTYSVAVSTAGFNGVFALDLDIPFYDAGHRQRLSASLPDPIVGDYKLGDLNGDGRPDLVVGTADRFGQRGAVNVFINDGSGRFPNTPSQSLSDDDWEVGGLDLADFNRDGLLDLAIANEHDDEVWIRLNKGDGTLTHPSGNTPDAGSPAAVVSADFNGDGILDIAALNSKLTFFTVRDDDDISILLGKGNGQFGNDSTVEIDGEDGANLQVGYVNDDGNPDLMVSKFDNDRNLKGIILLIGKGDPDRDGDADFTRQFFSINRPAELAQLGTDGRSDLVTFEDDALVITSYAGSAFGNPIRIGLSHKPYNLVVADVNRDGIPDIVTTSTDGTLSVMIGLGNKAFAPEKVIATLGGLRQMRAADIDGDGRSDLLLHNSFGSLIDIFLNQHESANGPVTTVDHVAPTIEITSPAGLTDQFVHTVAGFVSGNDAGARVLLYDANRFLGSATTDGAGRWSSSITLTGTGAHSITAETVDGAGNRGISAAATYIVNTAPVAAADAVSTPRGASLAIAAADLLANDVSEDGDPLAIASVGDAVRGSVALADGVVTFTPEEGYAGPASFTYIVSDGFGGTDTATVAVTVINAVDLGEGDDRYTAPDDWPITIDGGAGNDRIEGGGGDDSFTGGEGRDVFAFDNRDRTGRDVITDFGPTDVLTTWTALSDRNGDGIVTLGANGLLDLRSRGGGLVDLGEVEAVRSLGSSGGEYYYADAAVRPRGADGARVVEGVIGAETLTGSPGAADLFFVDAALGLPLGPDAIRGFGPEDLLVTTMRLRDNNGDGVIDFTRRGFLDIAPGASVALTGDDGAPVRRLEFDGEVAAGDVRYFVYSAVGSAVGAGDLLPGG